MNKKTIVVVSAAFFTIAFILSVFAEEKFGVRVYPGAKADPDTSKVVAQMSTGGAECFRTKDAVSTVVDFYKKQTGLKLVASSKEGAMFKKGKVDITIQNPWLDMKTGKQNSDTLISIVNQK